MISEHQLQSVLAWRQGDSRFCLAATKVNTLLRLWQWQRTVQLTGLIDQQMMMASIWQIRTRRCHTHAHQSKPNHERARYRLTIYRADKINLSARW